MDVATEKKYTYILASIQKIIALNEINGADTIERATVLGWNLVVKKNEFKVGDLVIYVEIDSILPDIELFSFLKPRGMRIRTVKLLKKKKREGCGGI